MEINLQKNIMRHKVHKMFERHHRPCKMNEKAHEQVQISINSAYTQDLVPPLAKTKSNWVKSN